jgi:hypothetical protein
MELEKEIFEGKTLSDVLKEVYIKKKENDEIVKDKIDSLSTFINTPGDAIVVIPLIKDLLDAGLKNDEVLMKIVQLFKQPAQINKGEKEEDTGILSEKDIAQLFNDINLQTSNTKKLIN